MPKLFAIGLIAALSAVAPSYASEDAAPYVFGGDVNYEVQGQDSIASQFTSGEDDLFNFSDVESLSAEHTAIPAENPMEAPDDAAPMDENDTPDAEALPLPRRTFRRLLFLCCRLPEQRLRRRLLLLRTKRPPCRKYPKIRL